MNFAWALMFLFVVIHNAMTRAEGELQKEEVNFVSIILNMVFGALYILQPFKSFLLVCEMQE